MKGKSVQDRMRAAAWAFARGASWEEAAVKAEVSKQTLSRYRNRPEWAEIFEEEKRRGELITLAVPSPSEVATLPTNWRNLASLTLATAAQSAALLMADAMSGGDYTKSQLDCARWILERMAVAAPEEAAQDEITDAGTMAAELADAVPAQVLREALRIAGTG